MTDDKFRALRWLACAVGLVAPCLLLAESARDRDASDEQQLVQRIADEQSAHGPHSPLLIESYVDLGHVYERAGLEAQALAAFTQARGVVRANYGLSSLEEVPVLEALIHAQEAVGYVEEPWELEHELLALAGAHPDDVRVVAIYAEIGDKRLDMLDRYVAGEFPPQLALGCYYERERVPEIDPARHERNCTAGSRNALIRAVAKEAWGYYYSAIRVLLENRLYASNELRDLETKILRSAYREGAYRFGRASLRRSLSYDVANGESLLARIDSLLRIADWDIITTHVRHDRSVYDFALDAYRDAYEKLTTEGVDRRAIDALFSPDIPVVLPTFEDNPLASTRTDTAAYIDIAFDVTQYGYAKRIEILDTTTSTSRETQKALIHIVANSIFRPRAVEGRIAAAAHVVMRYYVND